MSSPGDQCPRDGCPGRVRVRTSRRIGQTQEQRLDCNTCGHDCGKRLVMASSVYPRSSA